MDSSSSPPVLYLGDDEDEHNNEQNHYFETHMSLPQVSSSSSSSDMHLPRKKRKLSDVNVRVNTSIVNWSKRQRNDHYQHRLSHTSINQDLDSELILLDPNEYVIEEPDSHSYRSFDWTIQVQPTHTTTKFTSNSIQTVPRVPIAAPLTATKRSIEKPNAISMINPRDKFIHQQQQQQQRKAIPMPSTPLLTLPLPKPTSTFVRHNNTQRGRPLKNSRLPTNQLTSSPPPPIRFQTEPPIYAQKQPISRPPPLLPTTTVSASSINNSPLEIRRQLLNGTGIFSAFHDSKHYRCNICKFKSVTSSTLLQHLFTHMFFCDHCSFYTYSYYTLSQHTFEKHNLNLIEDIHEPLNPKSFDLLYVTRCSDGTFALCMDSSSSSSSATSKISTNDQRCIISSATPNDQHQNKPPKKKIIQKKQLPPEEDNDIVLITDKQETNLPRSSSVQSKRKEKHNQTYIIMKHRRFYSRRKSPYSHPLTLEYNICREHTIRYMSHTQEIEKRRKFLSKFHNTRLIDEVANCLKTIVNQIVDAEDNSNQLSFVQPLPNNILNSILSTDNLNTLTSLLKLNNKYDQYVEQKHLSEDEYSLRQSREHIFILSSPETNHTEQSIISALHSSLTNGDSIFTQTKVEKLPTNFDNTHRYLKGNPTNNTQPQATKNQKKVTPVQPSSKQVPFRPVISKPSRPFPTSSADRNNNTLVPPKPKTISNVIILD